MENGHLRHRKKDESAEDKDASSDRKLRPGRPVSAHPPQDIPLEKLKRIDYVLIYEDEEFGQSEEKQAEIEFNTQKRLNFEKLMTKRGMQIQVDSIDAEYEGGNKTIYVKIHTPLPVLCEQAEEHNFEMPMKDCIIYEDKEDGCCTRINDWFTMDDEDDFVSAPYRMAKHDIFLNSDDPDNFFRPSVRSYLTHAILINLVNKDVSLEEDPFARKGLLYLLHKGVYKDRLVLHDEALQDPALKDDKMAYRDVLGSQFLIEDDSKSLDIVNDPEAQKDSREVLSQTWAKRWVRYQPLWKIRNYFGEKIALYFAWTGTLVMTLWVPTLVGLGVFFYGLYLSITDPATSSNSTNSTAIERVQQTFEDSINIIQKAFDNNVTPYFAILVCLWGTVFLEVWKRKRATLAYEWDVDTFENAEPDRPEFVATDQRPDPVIPDEIQFFYPFRIQFLKFTGSLLVLLFMCGLVFVFTALVILYRVWTTVDFCATASSTECLIVSTLMSTVIQAVVIMVLGRIYEKMAMVLTKWENHRTQTGFEDALIIKLFAFQFVNSYTSLFYIAFFRGQIYENGIFGLGREYQDNCGEEGNCMGMLSLQVLILMILKPMPKFLKDVILPFVMRQWRIRVRHCVMNNCCCCLKGKACCRKRVSPSAEEGKKVLYRSYLEREGRKPELGEFTLAEYTEKVIVYGYLMLFSASMPLAPLIVLLVNAIDIRVDARRMLWWFRRPVAFIAQDIGMWYGILQVLNLIGVATNAFLIAFTSAWASDYQLSTKLWIVIGFEHIVYIIKFLIATIIPDVPAKISLAMKREKYNVANILTGNYDPNVISSDPSKSKTPSANYRPQNPSSLNETHRIVPNRVSHQLGSAPPLASEKPPKKAEATLGPSTLRREPTGEGFFKPQGSAQPKSYPQEGEKHKEWESTIATPALESSGQGYFGGQLELYQQDNEMTSRRGEKRRKKKKQRKENMDQDEGLADQSGYVPRIVIENPED